MRLELRRLDIDLPIPSCARDDDTGLDFNARESVALAPGGGRAAVPTGLSCAIPPGHVGLVVPRSGLAADHGVTVLNAPGIVDSGYRGEVLVVLVNLDPHQPYAVSRGNRIAQLVITSFQRTQPIEVDQLTTTNRGEGGLGHTGRK